MVKSSVQDAISVSPGISGTLDWDYNSKTMLKFNLSQALQSNTKYTITIGTGARDIFGTNMKEPYTYSFVTRPE
jgi:hypothetical protein